MYFSCPSLGLGSPPAAIAVILAAGGCVPGQACLRQRAQVGRLRRQARGDGQRRGRRAVLQVCRSLTLPSGCQWIPAVEEKWKLGT